MRWMDISPLTIPWIAYGKSPSGTRKALKRASDANARPGSRLFSTRMYTTIVSMKAMLGTADMNVICNRIHTDDLADEAEFPTSQGLHGLLDVRFPGEHLDQSDVGQHLAQELRSLVGEHHGFQSIRVHSIQQPGLEWHGYRDEGDPDERILAKLEEEQPNYHRECWWQGAYSRNLIHQVAHVRCVCGSQVHDLATRVVSSSLAGQSQTLLVDGC